MKRLMNLMQLKSWYDQVYWNREHKRSVAVSRDYSKYLEYLDAKPECKILDVGCGAGALLKPALERGLIVFGVDISTSGLKLARKFAPKAYFVEGAGEQLPFPNSTFDYLTCLGSLEHFLDVEFGLREMVRVCKQGAGICIIVPNSFYLFDIIGVMKTGYSRNGTFQLQEKLATLGEWKDLLKAHGLVVLAIYRDKEPKDTRWCNIYRDFYPMRIINRFIEKVLQAIMPLNLGYQFIFVCRKET